MRDFLFEDSLLEGASVHVAPISENGGFKKTRGFVSSPSQILSMTTSHSVLIFFFWLINGEYLPQSFSIEKQNPFQSISYPVWSQACREKFYYQTFNFGFTMVMRTLQRQY